MHNIRIRAVRDGSVSGDEMLSLILERWSWLGAPPWAVYVLDNRKGVRLQ